MKGLFKHLSAITQGEPGSTVNYLKLPSPVGSSPFVSTTLLAVLLGVPQVIFTGNQKVLAQTSCPAGSSPQQVRLNPSDNLADLTQVYNVGGITTTFTLTEEFPNQVIDRSESRVEPGIYGGVQGPDLRLNIGPGKPPETGNLSPGSATLTITFDQAVNLASPLTLLDVDRDGERDVGRTFQDVVTVSASNSNNNVDVNLQALGPFTRVSGNTAFGIVENSFPENPDANVSVTPQGTVDQIRILYQPGTEFGQPGQDQTIGLAPFNICVNNQVGSIGDTVYTDGNRNNIQDEGELGIEGVTVSLITPGDDEIFGNGNDVVQATTTTNANGIYSFPNLPAGNYRVTAAAPTDFSPTQTQPDTVNLQAGQNIDTVDFGFAPGTLGAGQGSIGDTVYNDTNRNNIQDEGETGISGATVTLILPGEDGQFGTDDDDTSRTATTNENGNYSFPDLAGGNYRVTATTTQGLTPTQTQPDIINLQDGQNLDTVDFGFAPQQGTGSIGDTVYRDSNNNNIQDDGDTGIAGVTVTLILPGEDGQFGTDDDDTSQTTTTDNNGIYGFTNLPAGNYRVTAATPEDLTPTQTQPDIINLQDGQNLDTVDFGFAPGRLGTGQGSIGDTVYRDINGNGQQDADEPGIPGVEVNFDGTGPDGEFGDSLDDDDISGRTRTDSNGRYIFPDLPAGAYRVNIKDPLQEPIRGLSPTQVPASLINLAEDQNFEDADFGFTQSTGTIGDTVYQDNDNDGTQDQDEPGIPNVVVTLTRPGDDNQLGTGDDITETATTNGNGNYSFPNLPIGNYRVTVENPPENLSPTQTPPSVIPLQANQNFDTADFGFSPQQVGTIGDFVFYDNDGDSTPDNDEIGIPGLTLILRNNNGDVVATTNTDENGFYNFIAPPGTYTVSIANPPQGLAPTLTQDNPINLQANQNRDDVDFGFQPPAQGSIGDTVFADVNRNGTQDPGEPGVSGAVVRLIRPGQDGVFNTSDDQIEEQRTDNTETVAFNENTPGQYTFNNLPPGNYQVQLVLPDGSILTTGTNPIPVNLQPNQNLESADFGIIMTPFEGEVGSIGDEVFNDSNGNGQRDEDEPGVPGVTLTLTTPGPDGELDTPDDDSTRTTTTNQDGIYTFDNLPPGPYRVTVSPPLELPQVTNPEGPVIQRNLGQGQNLTNVDFGLTRPEGGSIGDTVFLDRNGNAQQNQGEPGIPDVELILRDSNGNIVNRTETNGNGNYIFSGLPLGSYTVQSETPNEEFRLTTTNNPFPTTLSAENPDPRDVDFGFQPPGVGGASGEGPVDLTLIKRITRIEDQTFTNFEDGSGEDDNDLNGVAPVQGIITRNEPVQRGDIIEYAVYFLKEGADQLPNVRVCDLIPGGTTLVPNSIQIEGQGTGDNAGDTEEVPAPGPIAPEFQTICGTGDTAENGAVLINLGTLSNGIQNGVIRFRVRVN